MIIYGENGGFTQEFLRENSMGPNPLRMLQELLAGEHRVKVERIWPMACYEQAWAEWLACDNPYAIGDRAAMEAGAGQYMNLLGIVLKRI